MVAHEDGRWPGSRSFGEDVPEETLGMGKTKVAIYVLLSTCSLNQRLLHEEKRKVDHRINGMVIVRSEAGVSN